MQQAILHHNCYFQSMYYHCHIHLKLLIHVQYNQKVGYKFFHLFFCFYLLTIYFYSILYQKNLEKFDDIYHSFHKDYTIAIAHFPQNDGF